MEINATVNNEEVTVSLKGSLYVEDAAILREKLIAFMESGCKNFIIKLGNVDYIDSSGLGVLVAIQKKALQKKGSVTLVGATGTVKDLFELTRLSHVFTMLQ